jgi:hypothetical protein
MALFIILVITIIGITYLERQYVHSSREAKLVPVRNDDNPIYRRKKDYLR